MPTKVESLLLEYVLDREVYYRKKLQTNYPLKDIIQESTKHQDLPILKYLILQEFPQHRDSLFKYLMLQ